MHIASKVLDKVRLYLLPLLPHDLDFSPLEVKA